MKIQKDFFIFGSIALAVFMIFSFLGFGNGLTGYSILEENLTISINNPENGATINYTDVTISITTNEEATCQIDNNDMFTTGSTLHLEPLTDLEVGEHSYSIDCANDNYTAQKTITFTIEQIAEQQEEENEIIEGNETNETIVPELTIVSPEDNSTTNTENITVEITTNQQDCTLGGEQFAEGNLDITLEEGTNVLLIECENISESVTVEYIIQEEENETETYVSIPITITKQSPSLTTLREKNVIIQLTTNVNATCKYDSTQFTTTGLLSHQTQITNLVEDQTYSYNVECTDVLNSSNKKTITVGFIVDTEYCGDNECQSSETASSCKQDCDTDDDGILDEDDMLLGEKEDVTTENLNSFEIKIEGSTNLQKNFTGTREVKLYSSGKVIIDFDYKFDEQLKLEQIEIEKQDSNDDYGYLLVKGLDLNGKEKTVYVDAKKGTNTICAIDEEVNSISTVSEDCDEDDEILIECPGEKDGIKCTKESDRYKIEGLEHSAIKEIEDQNQTEELDTCAMYWLCSPWTPSICPPEGRQTRSCQNSRSECTVGKPDVVRECVYTPTCSDGIRNQGETQTDCGGPCKPCIVQRTQPTPVPVSTTATGKATTLEEQEPAQIEEEKGSWLSKLFLWMIILIILGIGGTGTYIYVKPQIQKQKIGRYSLDDIKEALDMLSEPIHKALIQGNTEQEIKDSLLAQGWDMDLVEEIMKVYQFEDNHKQLYEYLKKEIGKGKDIGELRKNLLSKKWSKKLVDEMIKIAK